MVSRGVAHGDGGKAAYRLGAEESPPVGVAFHSHEHTPQQAHPQMRWLDRLGTTPFPFGLRWLGQRRHLDPFQQNLSGCPYLDSHLLSDFGIMHLRTFLSLANHLSERIFLFFAAFGKSTNDLLGANGACLRPGGLGWSGSTQKSEP